MGGGRLSLYDVGRWDSGGAALIHATSLANLSHSQKSSEREGLGTGDGTRPYEQGNNRKRKAGIQSHLRLLLHSFVQALMKMTVSSAVVYKAGG
jgi:hypothetical protein